MLTPWSWYRPYGHVSCEYVMMSGTSSGKKWLSSRQSGAQHILFHFNLIYYPPFPPSGATSP